MSDKLVKRLVFVCLILSILIFPTRVGLAQSGVDVPGAMEKGFDFMNTLQTETGGFDGMGAGADAGTTARFVLALAAAEKPSDWAVSKTGKTAMDYLKTEVKNFTMTDGVFKPGRAGLIMAAGAAGGADVSAFGGINLVKEMQAMYDPAAGTYGPATMTSVSDQAWAIIGLSMSGETIPAEATTWLLNMQVATSTMEITIGGWDSGWGVDPDTTGLAVTALMSSGNVTGTDPVIESARGYFHKNQLATGGWKTEWDTAGNPNSTAWGILALTGAGDNLQAWATAEGDPVTELAKLQNENGSFGPYANGFSTVEALMALSQKPIFLLKQESEPKLENRLGIVIDFGGGRVETHCVTLPAEKTTGLEILNLAGVTTELLVDPGLGAAVCQVQDVGCPKENCWCSKPNYWAYWHMVNGEWAYSEKGASQSQTQVGMVEGWVWGGGDQPSVKPDLSEICDSKRAVEATTTQTEVPAVTPTVISEATTTSTPGVKNEATQPVQAPTTAPTAAPVPQGGGAMDPLIILGLVVVVLLGVLLFLRSRQ